MRTIYTRERLTSHFNSGSRFSQSLEVIQTLHDVLNDAAQDETRTYRSRGPTFPGNTAKLEQT